MAWVKKKTLIATAAAVVLPLGALVYLASVPGRRSPGVILLQVAVVVAGLVGFALMLARLLEQIKAARVGRWLKTPEGRTWLDTLPAEERERFEGRLDDFR